MPKKGKHKLGQTHIRAWRKYRGFSQVELAEEVNLAQGSLSDLENGRFAYTQPVLENLAKILRCTPADLLERPPGAVDEIRDALEELDQEGQKRALAVVRALKDSEAA